MRSFTTTVTQRGQVTIPAEVRRKLGVKARDKVTFTMEDGKILVSPARFTLETAFGSVKPSRRPEDFEEMGRIVEEEVAQRVIEEMRRK